MKIKFGEIVFDNIPESYSDLTLGKYLELDALKTEADTLEDPIDKAMVTFEIYAKLIGCPVEFLTEMKAKDTEVLVEAFSWINQLPENKIKYNFEIDGMSYICRKDFNDYTNAEVISIQSIIGNSVNLNVDLIPSILSIIIRPGVEKENEYGEVEIKQMSLDKFDGIKKRADLFKEKLMIEDVWGLLLFFYAGGKTSLTQTHTSTPKIKIEKKTKELKKSNKNPKINQP